ncbi:MAG: hypothetical protein ACYCZ1_02215 [Candidatus Humimicrobiaceae bacterium]
MKDETIKKAVRESYAKVATGSSCGCGSSSGNCCSQIDTAKQIKDLETTVVSIKVSAIKQEII